ncbi:uncharacterized protein LOC129228404 [Uloborus diversus]|uniref:uncharacterized protein LOC129228404 n=1 Tax=Uloborus diversus TaxID=327109 RepID=UPI0024094F62|nr:uncharacterized protein LOC129228404 [Uloborus diversus]
MLWREETELKRAIYASLQETRRRNWEEDEEEEEEEENGTQDEKKESPPAENGLESPKKAKVHAQRKFAQGSTPTSPVPTPVKVVPFVSTSTMELLPCKRPKTEDFLTFLCLRGSAILPPSLDFLNSSSKSDTSSECRSLSPDPDREGYKEVLSDPKERRIENGENGYSGKHMSHKASSKKLSESLHPLKKSHLVNSKISKESQIVKKRKSRNEADISSNARLKSSSVKTKPVVLTALQEKYKKQRLAADKRKLQPTKVISSNKKGLVTRSQSVKKQITVITRKQIKTKDLSPIKTKKETTQKKLAVEKRKSLRSADPRRELTRRRLAALRKKTPWLRRAKLVPPIVDVDSDSEPEVIIASPPKKSSQTAPPPKKEKSSNDLDHVTDRLRRRKEIAKSRPQLSSRQLLLRKHMQKRLKAKKSALQQKNIRSKAILKTTTKKAILKNVRKGVTLKTMSLRKDLQNKRVTRSAKHQIEEMLWANPEKRSKTNKVSPLIKSSKTKTSSPITGKIRTENQNKEFQSKNKSSGKDSIKNKASFVSDKSLKHASSSGVVTRTKDGTKTEKKLGSSDSKSSMIIRSRSPPVSAKAKQTSEGNLKTSVPLKKIDRRSSSLERPSLSGVTKTTLPSSKTKQQPLVEESRKSSVSSAAKREDKRSCSLERPSTSGAIKPYLSSNKQLLVEGTSRTSLPSGVKREDRRSSSIDSPGMSDISRLTSIHAKAKQQASSEGTIKMSVPSAAKRNDKRSSSLDGVMKKFDSTSKRCYSDDGKFSDRLAKLENTLSTKLSGIVQANDTIKSEINKSSMKSNSSKDVKAKDSSLNNLEITSVPGCSKETNVQNNLNLQEPEKSSCSKDISKLISLNVREEENLMSSCDPCCSSDTGFVKEFNIEKSNLVQSIASNVNAVEDRPYKKTNDPKHIKKSSVKEIGKPQKDQNKTISSEKDTKHKTEGSDDKLKVLFENKNDIKKQESKLSLSTPSLDEPSTSSNFRKETFRYKIQSNEEVDKKEKNIFDKASHKKEFNVIKQENVDFQNIPEKICKDQLKFENPSFRPAASKCSIGPTESKVVANGPDCGNIKVEMNSNSNIFERSPLKPIHKDNKEKSSEDKKNTFSSIVEEEEDSDEYDLTLAQLILNNELSVVVVEEKKLNCDTKPTQAIKERRASEKEAQKSKKEGESSKHKKEKDGSKLKSHDKSNKISKKDSGKSLAKLLKKEKLKSIKKEEKSRHKKDNFSSSKSSKKDSDRDSSKTSKKDTEKEDSRIFEKPSTSGIEYLEIKKEKSSKKDGSKLSRSNSYDDSKSPKKKKKHNEFKDIEKIKNLINKSSILNEISGFKDFKRRSSSDKSELKKLSKSKKRKKLALLKEKKLSKKLSSKLLRKYSKKKGLKSKKNKLKKKELRKEMKNSMSSGKLHSKSKKQKHKAKGDHHKKDSQEKIKNLDCSGAGSTNKVVDIPPSEVIAATVKPDVLLPSLPSPLPEHTIMQPCRSDASTSAVIFEIIPESLSAGIYTPVMVPEPVPSITEEIPKGLTSCDSSILEESFSSGTSLTVTQDTPLLAPFHFVQDISEPKKMADAATNTGEDDIEASLSSISEVLKSDEMSVGTQTITPVASPSPTIETRTFASQAQTVVIPAVVTAVPSSSAQTDLQAPIQEPRPDITPKQPPPPVSRPKPSSMAAPKIVKKRGPNPKKVTKVGLHAAREPFSLTVPKMVAAPVYHPTEEEFGDPLEYVLRIGPEASKYGICKIVPPPSFKPECKVNDDMRFTAHNQFVHKMLYRWGPNVQHRACIRRHLRSQKVKLEHGPLIGGIELDISRFYHIVQQLGGLQQVIEKKKWQRVADALHVPKTAQDRVTKLYDAYCKYLVSYDVLPMEEKQKLEEEVLADHEKKLKMRNEPKDPEREEPDDEETNDCVTKGRSMSLSNFFRIARNMMSIWFKNEPAPEEVEHEFWRLVTEREQHVVVHAGNIDSSVYQSGFPSARNSPFAKHSWNLKMLTNNSKSILRSMGPVSGITIPTLHLGMPFTTGCWYRDPHCLPWIEYLHTGASKIWYGIPGEGCEKFREGMKKIMPECCTNNPIWLPSDTAMVPPDLLVKNGVSLSRAIQDSGQFVVIFPESFTSTICSGYCVSESVYFAPSSWLDLAPKAFQDIRSSCEPSAFSLERLLFSIGNDPRSQPDALQKILPMVKAIREKEINLRFQLNEAGVKQSEKLPIESRDKKKKSRGPEDDGENECEICRTHCYLSMVLYPQDESIYCLPHALESIPKKNLKSCKLMYTYSEVELNEVQKKIEELLASQLEKAKKKSPKKKALIAPDK